MIPIRLKIIVPLVIAVAALTGAVSCSPKKPMPASGASVPAGPLMQDDISYQFAIFYLPLPTNDPNAKLDGLLAEKFARVKKVERVEPGRPGIFLASQFVTNVQETYPIPRPEFLKYFGRGISRNQAEAVQDSQQALLLNFGYSKSEAWDGMRTALQLTSAVAEQTGGLIWDGESRELFTPEVWVTNRLTGWDAGTPDISRHTVMHAYRDEEKERSRAVTLGMVKFGLPDIVVENFSWSESQNVGHLMNVFAQAIADGIAVRQAGEFDLDIRALKNAGVRELHLNSIKPKATGRAALALQPGRWESGDPSNRLVEITFDRYDRRDLRDRQNQLLWTMFGREESVVGARSNDGELLAASQRAREKLPALRNHFNQGLTPGERLLVKASFTTSSGGKEYMWVEISGWNADRITGLLRDEPRFVPGLHGGQTVTVSEKDVFDYVRYLPDGTMEGDETSKIIREQQGKRVR